jgi:hypothetical protein
VGEKEVCTLVYVSVTVVEKVAVVDTVTDVYTVDVVDASAGVKVDVEIEVIVVV